ncbi:MAG: hypothetical protein RLZZ15_4403 [Verrucomicrobiota bacterium]|jgi:hypothetical protein
MKKYLAALCALLPLLAFAQPPQPPTTPSAPAARVAAPALFAVRLSTGPAWDPAKSPNDQAGMKEHSANIARLRRDGTLVLGARFGELGLLVLRVPDEAAARAALAPDPTIASGVFKTQIDPFAPFAHGTTAYLTTPEAITLRAYLDAYNRHEPDAVAALLAPAVKWFSLDADKLSVDGEGRDAVRTWLTGYFKSLPDVRSEFLSIEQTGAFLAVRERASWTAKDGKPRSQQAHAIYEIREAQIVRAWYFPSVRDPAPAAK